jgi:hypothetical protein
MAFEKKCYCGKESARLHHLNTILPHEAVKTIYCPTCSQGININTASMVQDNGWVIEYDMDVATLYTEKMGLSGKGMTPEIIFDQGFSSWQGYTPNDLEQSNQEKMELAKVAKTDPKRYLGMIREWTLKRAKRLQEEGWRKAKEEVVA